MFKGGVVSQGNFLVKMLSLSLTLLNDQTKFYDTLYKLAENHCKKGIKAIEYGIVGEVLFYSLKKVLGSEYSKEVHRAWIKIFSRMLKIMVPVAVAFELKSGAAQSDRFSEQSSTLDILLAKRAEPQKATLDAASLNDTAKTYTENLTL